MKTLCGSTIAVAWLIGLHAVALGSALEVYQQKVVVNASQLAIIPISPNLFKWDKLPGYVNQIEYTARISNSPDLPSWLKYTYEGYNSVGYLYGVPPSHLISLNLDIIGRNKNEGFDVRKLVISLEILRTNPLEHIVEIKIDNMNVKDLCIPKRMNDLLSVLSDQLGWTKKDGNKVVPVFMASAVALGENRVPVRPSDAEGVVLHFASDQEFSPELKKLQVEVLPLWKLRPCPRDLKRTSMERHFRKYTFLVDWCYFRLLTRSSSGDEQGKTTKDQAGNIIKNERTEGDESDALKSQASLPSEPEVFQFRSVIPVRGYGVETLIATIIPGSIGGLIGFLLIALLWTDRDEDAPLDADTLFFEAAFRMLLSMLRIKQGNGNGKESQYIYHQAPQVDSGVVILTRDNGHGQLGQYPESINEREMMSTPVPPQYGETHPNGTPALIYAV